LGVTGVIEGDDRIAFELCGKGKLAALVCLAAEIIIGFIVLKLEQFELLRPGCQEDFHASGRLAFGVENSAVDWFRWFQAEIAFWIWLANSKDVALGG